MDDLLKCNNRYRLLPYIVEQAKQGAKRGLPLVRAMVLEYPEDPTTWRIDTQYHFGDDLLIAPILQPLDELNMHTVYLPAGTWFDFWTKEKLHSRGQWLFIDPAPLESMPIWVRSGAKIPFTTERLRTSNEVGKVEMIEHYGTDGAHSTPGSDG